ncbi:hypothetical protein FAZ19_19385 [Sphingobacterium alkalisoli]|uniref:DUF6965 domain-containing protein n=1 Tax=Sphingobacterium alkalisoli TaxID=1874115 RepID=A0A4U0GUI2_9SPHI|nr:hypothetical protein [Sphingobacterium alkalisoli]TJY62637.1 hypothetical protein FAZ19_19385 [Sphingobacterium alkalisoli]GGH27926.1 hypothetical protein GCM10011418_38180 [Sphingobacterium alkalisoli]
MTVEELRSALLGKEYPETVRISKDQTVTDVDKFLHIQFIMCEQWTKDIAKSPAYGRLLKFYEATR